MYTTPQGKPISEDVQWIVIHLSANLSTKDVAMYTNISRCKVKAIQAYHNQTSGFDIPKCEKSNLYCKLQEEDIRVCLQHSFFCLFFLAVLHSISTRH